MIEIEISKKTLDRVSYILFLYFVFGILPTVLLPFYFLIALPIGGSEIILFGLIAGQSVMTIVFIFQQGYIKFKVSESHNGRNVEQ